MANLVQNGNFDNPDITVSANVVTINNWTKVSGTSGIIDMYVNGSTYSHSGLPSSITQAAYINVSIAGTSSISQSITFPYSGNYVLSLWVSQNTFSFNVNNKLVASVGAIVSKTMNVNAINDPWTQYFIPFYVNNTQLTQTLLLDTNNTGSTSTNGQNMWVTGVSIIYNDTACFAKKTLITCLDNHSGKEIYVPVEDLYDSTNDYLVKTLNNGYKPIRIVGKQDILNEYGESLQKNHLYQLFPINYPCLFKPLILTGNHGILVHSLSEEEKSQTEKQFGKVFVTDGHYRLFACIDKRAFLYTVEGSYTIYHIVLESDDDFVNYGIYANGLLVESCSLWSMQENSSMEQKGNYLDVK